MSQQTCYSKRFPSFWRFSMPSKSVTDMLEKVLRKVFAVHTIKNLCTPYLWCQGGFLRQKFSRMSSLYLCLLMFINCRYKKAATEVFPKFSTSITLSLKTGGRILPPERFSDAHQVKHGLIWNNFGYFYFAKPVIKPYSFRFSDFALRKI